MALRNIAIIAHVDHGKTTLIDVLLRQSGSFRENQRVEERAMDSNDLERERGITILAKVTSLVWKDTRINIVDTPGHADFGGEVERILSMVDGVVILVDAAEGPMPQTKFVLGKALAQGLRPIVAINKIDRPDERHLEVLEEIFDLFIALEATPEQLDFPVLYGSAKQGWMSEKPEGPKEDLVAAARQGGRICEARPRSKRARSACWSPPSSATPSSAACSPAASFRARSRRATRSTRSAATARKSKRAASPRSSPSAASSGRRSTVAEAGDIVAIAGLETTTVADTLTIPQNNEPHRRRKPIDPPTLSVTFRINDGPLAGREGDKVQSPRHPRAPDARSRRQCRHPRHRGHRFSDSFEVAGRGELQLAVLIENMRREGFELTIGRPRVVLREENGAEARADRGSHHRRRRRALRHRRAEAHRAQGRPRRHAPVGHWAARGSASTCRPAR